MSRTFTMWACVGLLLVASGTAAAKSKVLFIDSYHQGYPWSDGITEGVQNTLGDQVELKIHRMDTKIFSTLQLPADATPDQVKAAQEEFKKQAALKAKEIIDTWQPDVVIVADDNASKYLVAPYFKDSSIPFVFCGVNWDASGYGFPCSNVTGMIEADLIPQLVKAMKDYAKGSRVSFLGANTLTNQKNVKLIADKFDIDLDVFLADTFADWKAGFQKLQNESDMMIMYSVSGIKDFDLAEAQRFVLENTKIPTGCTQSGESSIALLGYTKLPQEQGQWAAQTALKILEGTSPSDIAVATNKKGQIYLNMPLAEKMGIRFPLSMVKQAKVITQSSMVAAN